MGTEDGHRGWAQRMGTEDGHRGWAQRMGTEDEGWRPVRARRAPKILLPSAVHLEERLTVSQSVPEPASRQSDRYTQFGFFVSGRCAPKQQGGPSPQCNDRYPRGRRSEPQSAHFGAAAGGDAKSQ